MKCKHDNPKNCMMYECGKCMEPIYVPENKCQWREPETNADRIRAMSDEELEVFLSTVKCRGAALEACGEFWGDNSFELDWLKQEAEAGK